MAGGAPTKYKEEYAEQAFKYKLLGATDEEMAGFFEVSVKTLNNWKHEHPEFLQSIKDGGANADANVSKSLYKRATGYKYTETTKEVNEAGQIAVSKIVVKEVAPDTNAGMRWLGNRRRNTWREKQAPLPIKFEFDKDADPSQQAIQIMEAASKGQVTMEAAQSFLASLANAMKIVEVDDHGKRLDELENSMGIDNG